MKCKKGQVVMVDKWNRPLTKKDFLKFEQINNGDSITINGKEIDDYWDEKFKGVNFSLNNYNG